MAFISEEQVIRVLQQYNPWWRNPKTIREHSRPQKRFAYHEAMNVISHPSIRRFALLSGARRVGKTTIMYQMMESLMEHGIPPVNILYVSFDNPIIKLVTIDDVINIYESLYPIQGKRYLFFDEVQYTDNWELWMKVLYDTRENIKLVSTGSASPILEKRTADSGAGRWTILKVPTLSFYEYCELLQLADRPVISSAVKLINLVNLTKAELFDLFNRFSPLKRHFNRYLTIGGFPELVLSDDDAYAQRILSEDVADKVIKRDVLSLFSVRNPLLLEKLFLYLCINSSEIFNAQKASKELENISVITLENYIGFLENSNLIYRSNPINVGTKELVKARHLPKIFIIIRIKNPMNEYIAGKKVPDTTIPFTVFSFLYYFLWNQYGGITFKPVIQALLNLIFLSCFHKYGIPRQIFVHLYIIASHSILINRFTVFFFK
jgi:predicted AAA+ superfamily ATPase